MRAKGEVEIKIMLLFITALGTIFPSKRDRLKSKAVDILFVHQKLIFSK